MNQAVRKTENPIDFLSLRVFPAKLTIRAKAELLTDQKREDAFAYIKAIDEFEAELSQLSESAIEALVADELESDRLLAKEQADEEENKRFFYDRAVRADYVDWIRRDSWTVDEAIALLLGKDPGIVNWHSINPLVYKSKFAKRYADLRVQVKEALASGELHESQTPAAYLLFAKSSGFALPAELEVLITPVKVKKAKRLEAGAAGDGDESADDPDCAVSMFKNLLQQNRAKLTTNVAESPYPEETDEPAARPEPEAAPDTILSMLQERETLLRMLGAMAVGGYGFEPGSGDNSVTETIVNDFRENGLSVNPVAAHKLISDAARLVLARKQRD
jgi:hypothetical protein